MRIDLKNTRIAARRVLQGGATFAALGALSIATALPAAADAQVVGWAYAEVPGGFGVAETYVTPQGESSSDSNGGSFAIDQYLSVDVSTSASVGAGGSTATTTVNSARLVLTEADVEEIIEEIETQSEEGDEAEEEAGETDELGETDEAEEGDEAGESDEADQPAEEPAPAEGENGGDTGEGDADTGDADGDEGGAVEEETSPAPAEESVSVSLDEENSETVSGSDKIVLDVTISGASVTTTQSWSGEVSNTYKAGSIVHDVDEFDTKVTLYSDEGIYDSEEAGYLWEDAYTALLVEITVPGQFSGGYALGVTYAGIGVEPTDDGGDGGGKGDDDKDDKGGDEGEDKNPPKRDTEKLPQPEPKETESLARTGSPIAGLIAAGGGAAAYFARRKKNAVESTTENSES